ncbi:phenylpyruvate tautomerase MIF-related protein [Oscillatoria sp. CS-180]|uniref:phenylpyruvate tautomerase MIF-related protein n=1 Tax=Oscillatoria sp. CS-180 TaxID=3021720 RepID=UPI00232FD687|nr:phenylpyruvate tautomerase MIF-related protein [Oscillatoria sp. CS-180]MDB9528815.1 phenylpyruvate tautomerase MIF-related protein [Oscillatoria sp. CS-180]
MPLIKLQTSVPSPNKADIDRILKDLSSSLASYLGKPESYVMTVFEGDVPMTFGGSTDPVCYVEIKSVGTMGSKTRAMSEEFCTKIEDALGVPKNRTYIEFADAAGSMWGWNGTTFG